MVTRAQPDVIINLIMCKIQIKLKICNFSKTMSIIKKEFIFELLGRDVSL